MDQKEKVTVTNYEGIDPYTLPQPPTVSKSKKKDGYVYDCSPCEICGYATAVVFFFLTLILGIVFIALTAVGKENTSSSDCDCTGYTPSMGYGLGASYLIEVGLLVVLLVFLLVMTNTKTEDIRRLFFAFSIFTVVLVILKVFSGSSP